MFKRTRLTPPSNQLLQNENILHFICSICGLFLFTLLIRIPASSGLEASRFFSLLIPCIILLSLNFYLWKFSRSVIVSYFCLTAFYLMIPYLKLTVASILPAREIIQSWAAAALVFSGMMFLFYCTHIISSKFHLVLKGISLLFLIAALFSPCLIIGYYILSGHLLTADIILTLFQTNLAEASSYIADRGIFPWLNLLLFIAGIATLIIIALKNISFIPQKRKWILLYFLCMIFSIAHVTPRLSNFYVYEIIHSSFLTLQSFKEYTADKESRLRHLQSLSNLHIANQAGGIYAVVIGESETRDHMHAYGYKRENTPWLTSMKNDPGLLLFTHAYSNHTHTVPALTYALTEKNQYNQIPLQNAYSILETAKAAGYSTYWISNQQKYGAWDTPISAIASTADHEIWLNHNVGKQTKTSVYDEKLVEAIPDFSDKKDVLVIIHLMGNHGSYSDRYPNTFAKFDGTEKTIDAYDNSILYTDFVLQKIYEKLSTLNNFKALIYLSDHGEDVEHNYSHESTKFTWVMSRIPFFIYCSPRFQITQPEIYQALSTHRNDYWTNDLLYNSLISILGIEGAPHPELQSDLALDSYHIAPPQLTTLHGGKHIIDDPQY